jgi:hypothetical protein
MPLLSQLPWSLDDGLHGHGNPGLKHLPKLLQGRQLNSNQLLQPLMKLVMSQSSDSSVNPIEAGVKVLRKEVTDRQLLVQNDPARGPGTKETGIIRMVAAVVAAVVAVAKGMARGAPVVHPGIHSSHSRVPEVHKEATVIHAGRSVVTMDHRDTSRDVVPPSSITMLLPPSQPLPADQSRECWNCIRRATASCVLQQTTMVPAILTPLFPVHSWRSTGCGKGS